MVRHSAQRLVAPVCIALLSLAAACRSPILGAPDATGTLTIVLPAASASRPASRAASRAPGGLASLAGTVTRWVLDGDGPGGHSDSWEFDAATVSAAGNTVSLELLVGDWTITVRGYEADGGEAFTATRTVTVARDGENVVQLTLEWAEKALVARFSFDSAIEDDKRRLAATPGNLYSSDPVIAASSYLTEPAVDGLAVAYIADADPEDYGAYIDIAAADGSGLELGQSFALSMWAYPTTESEDSDRVLITSQADPSADSPGFTVSVNAGLVTLSCSDGTATGATTRDGYEYGAWNHIAISIDGESGYASIYVNGAPNAGPLAFSGIPSDPTIRIGARMTNSGFFQGSFDDLRVYAGALAADEIAAIRADGYFSGGRGTAASPYLVATPMDLYNVRRFPAAHFRQTADIDLSANAMTSTWAPIVGPFTGTYDGGGRSVSNVALGALSKAGSGFFEQISPGGVVRNLTMTTVSGSSSAENLGALAGIITSATISDITITGIDLTGTIYIGGLAGTCSNSALTRINVEGAIASSATLATYLGGMAGQLSGTAVSCVAAVNVGPAAGTTSPNTQQVGGFAGSIREFSDIVDCHARGNILYGGAGNGLHIGGFAGQISQQAALQIQVRACTSSGSVATNEADYVGGFSGQLYATSNAIDLLIDDCSSTSTVTAPNGQYIGGFAGLAGIHTSGAGKNRITSSRSTGTVSANGTNSGSFVGGFIGYAKEGTVIEECSSTSNVSAKSQFIGGFAGALGSDAAAVGAPGSIKRSYATGTVTGSDTLGGFVGAVYQASSIENCYARGSIDPNFASKNGGFIGFVNLENGTPIVERSYFSGAFIDSGTGAFIGSTTIGQSYSGAMTCYWHYPTAGALGNPVNSGATGAVTGPQSADLDEGNDFGDWNETTPHLWTFAAGSYPTLAWEHE